jgi:hypothetical protein
MSNVYYINPNGISQKDLVGIIKDLETILGGTNVTGSVTFDTAGTLASVASSYVGSNIASAAVSTADASVVLQVASAASSALSLATATSLNTVASSLASLGVVAAETYASSGVSVAKAALDTVASSYASRAAASVAASMLGLYLLSNLYSGAKSAGWSAFV